MSWTKHRVKSVLRPFFKPVRPLLAPVLEGLHLRRNARAFDCVSSSGRRTWIYAPTGTWIGGHFSIPNASRGYHGILKQWWDFYGSGPRWLLVSETAAAKAAFQAFYPEKTFFTLDLYCELQGGGADVTADICAPPASNLLDGFDVVVCQATMEHLYDPAAAFRNMMAMLKPAGVLLIHTHTPPFPYHPFPRDYFRFSPDWFSDIGSHSGDVELLELYATRGHIFAAFRRCSPTRVA